MSAEQTIQVVGYCAAAASVASFFPQAWKVIKTRDVTGLSIRMYALTAVSFSLWLGYGILLGSWTLIAPNAICLAATMFILVMVVLPTQKRGAIAEKLDPRKPD
ncbi:MAG: SemiSWEET family transporter [Sphingorhabdus sp.]